MGTSKPAAGMAFSHSQLNFATPKFL